jgi:hypothetical protein
MIEKKHLGLQAFNNMHGFRGVEWSSSKKKYRARIQSKAHGRGGWLGDFNTPEEAARAYDAAARLHYGPEAMLNFPDEGENGLKKSREDGLCFNGHDLSVYGRQTPRQIQCKRCIADAANRRYHRNKAATF